MTKTAATSTATSTCWKDRRLFARSHVILNGRLRGGIEEQDCVVLDLSASGAMVRLSDPAPSPAHVAVASEHFGVPSSALGNTRHVAINAFSCCRVHYRVLVSSLTIIILFRLSSKGV